MNKYNLKLHIKTRKKRKLSESDIPIKKIFVVCVYKDQLDNKSVMTELQNSGAIVKV